MGIVFQYKMLLIFKVITETGLLSFFLYIPKIVQVIFMAH